jgi:hypothetical protein
MSTIFSTEQKEEKVRAINAMDRWYEEPPHVWGHELERQMREVQARDAIVRAVAESFATIYKKIKSLQENEARQPAAAPDTEAEFRKLAEQWRSETMFISLDRERVCNFAYQQIIGMGKDALPFIFRELKETTSDWFWALRAITRTDVEVRQEDKGNVHKIAEAWMEWGKQHGYVSG